MGESETVVTQSATVVGYTATGLHSSEHVGADLNATDVDATAPTSASSVGNGSNSDVKVSQIDLSSAPLEAPMVSNEEIKPPFSEGDGDQTSLGGENMAMEMNQAAVYDANANGVVVTNANGAVNNAHDGQMTTAEQQFDDGTVLSAEEERLWSIVKANSLDFNAWTSLIEETEKTSQDNVVKIRKVYDAFLAEFPLCYGYWKKYADHEARFGAIDKVVEVYERAVQGVTYSVDIWLHYCVFFIHTYGDPDTIRRLFERALAYVGTDYLSYPLWDKYIEYEYTQQEWGNLAMIYTRIFENPNQQLDRYFTSFKELTGSQPLTKLRTTEEAASAAAAKATGVSDTDGKGNEKEINSETVDEGSKPLSTSLTEDEEMEKYIAIREEIYRKTKEFDSNSSCFEAAIRRPYFHVRPLNDAELENWHNYLDFMERDGDFNKIFKLYERCLVACANYPEFWIRYILCMEASGSIELAENALARATQVFVKRQPEIHLFSAHFKEQHGDIPKARASYQLVHTEISPGLLEAIIDHANMERRLGNMEDAFTIYEQAIAIEKGKEHSQTLPVLFAQYARFVYLVWGNSEKAWDILVGALEHVQPSKALLEALMHLESIQSHPKRMEYVDSLVDKFITSGLDSCDAASINEKEELSSIYLEFLGLFGDVQAIKKAKDRHARLFLRHRSASASRKRHADDSLISDKLKLAKSYAGVPSTATSAVAAYPTAQNQWGSGYGTQPQPWPQPTLEQGQPYNTTAYAQQGAAYSGYYGTNYPSQQGAPASVPQTPVYGAAAYPSTYPAQAYTQQAYVAPPMAAATAPATQQPAVAPQSYYSGYY